jgi:malonyl-CoA/methylmalonyl-CoA synthetase
LTADRVTQWAKERLPPYQVPKEIKFVDSVPRNAMGKVNKKDLVKQLFPAEDT